MSSSNGPSSNSNAAPGYVHVPTADGPKPVVVGHRFNPSDVEIAKDYLRKQAFGIKLSCDVIIQKDDLYSYDADKLQINEYKHAKENQAYFFTYNGNKGNKTFSTCNGYWEVIREGQVIDNHEVLACKKTSVFYWGESPDGNKTDYVMKEFRLNPSLTSNDSTIRNNIENLVLCKVRLKPPRETTSASESSDYAESVESSVDGDEDEET